MRRRPNNQSPLSLFSFQDIIISVTGVFLLITLMMAVELAERRPSESSSVSESMAIELLDAIEREEKRLDNLREEVVTLRDSPEVTGDYTEESVAQQAADAAEEVRLLEDKNREFRLAAREFEHAADSAEAKVIERESDVQRRDDLAEQYQAMEDELEILKKSQRVYYSQIEQTGREVWLIELAREESRVAVAGRRERPLTFTGREQTESLLEWTKQFSPRQVRFVIIVHPGTTGRFKELRESLRDRGFSTGYDLLPAEQVAIDKSTGAL